MSLRFRVILVEPMYEGNVGAVCRAMMNFGFDDLVLVNPCPLQEFAKAMASHAKELLEEAKVVTSLEEALKGVDVAIGTTGKTAKRDRRHMRRRCLEPREIEDALKDKDGLVALVFGREDAGLYNDELERCDVVVSIPASDEYPVLNLSQATVILLYELSGLKGGDFKLAGKELTEKLYDNFDGLLEDIGYPEHKKHNTMVMLRRVHGRAMLGSNEYFTLMGVIRDTRLALKRKEER